MVTAADAQPGAKPILMAFSGPTPQRRWTVLIRLILLLPQLIMLGLLGLVAFVVVVIGWFAALVTGRLPTFAADFLTEYLRWSTRVTAYEFLLTDVYPPFALSEVEYPVRIAVDPTGRLNRLAVFFRGLTVIPAFVMGAIVIAGASGLMLFVTWLIVLISGTMPPVLYEAFAATLRYWQRANGYAVMLTAEYPWGLFGDRGAAGVASPFSGPVVGGYPPPPGAFTPPPGGYAASPPWGATAPSPRGPVPGGYSPPPASPPAGAGSYWTPAGSAIGGAAGKSGVPASPVGGRRSRASGPPRGVHRVGCRLSVGVLRGPSILRHLVESASECARTGVAD